MLKNEPRSQNPKAVKKSADPGWSTIALLLLAVVALGGSADPSLTEMAAATSLGSGGPLSQAIQDVVSQSVSLVLLGVVVLIGVPWLLAAIALAASYIRPPSGSARGLKH